MTLTNELRHYLRDEIKPLKESKKAIIKSAQMDIFRTLDNLDAGYQSMAKLRCFEEALNALTGADSKADFDSVYEWVGEAMIQKAGSTSQSTSQTGNLFRRCELAAWAQLYRAMKRMRVGQDERL